MQSAQGFAKVELAAFISSATAVADTLGFDSVVDDCDDMGISTSEVFRRPAGTDATRVSTQ
jgi:hypothetical protein